MLRIKPRFLTQLLCPNFLSPLTHSLSATLASLLFLRHTKHVLTSRFCYLLFFLPGMLLLHTCMACSFSFRFLSNAISSGKPSMTALTMELLPCCLSVCDPVLFKQNFYYRKALCSREGTWTDCPFFFILDIILYIYLTSVYPPYETMSFNKAGMFISFVHCCNPNTNSRCSIDIFWMNKYTQWGKHYHPLSHQWGNWSPVKWSDSLKFTQWVSGWGPDLK